MSTIALSTYNKNEISADDVSQYASSFVTEENFPVKISEKAIEMIAHALKESDDDDGDFLRLGIKGGGCAGFQYGLNFSDAVDEDDILTLINNVKVVIDNFSACYLKDCHVDYVDSLQGSGFKFLNPAAKTTCGCGSSFSA